MSARCLRTVTQVPAHASANLAKVRTSRVPFDVMGYSKRLRISFASSHDFGATAHFLSGKFEQSAEVLA